MKNILLSTVAIMAACLMVSCEKEPVIDDTTGENPETFYNQLNLDFISRIVYLKDDVNNYTETEVLNLTERNGTINYIVNTFYATEVIRAGKITGELVDAYDQTSASIPLTNEFVKKSYGQNPYTSYTEWDFDANSNAHIIGFSRSYSVFSNYFGGQVTDVYNATQGFRMFSWKKFPTTIAGYIRNVDNQLHIVDMYRSKIMYENKADSSWVDLPFATPTYGNTFDFETVGNSSGIVAYTTDNALKVFNIKNKVISTTAEIATSANKQFAGWDGYFTVAIYKNGSDVKKPYIVIRRNSTADIYQYDLQANTLKSVYLSLKMPDPLVFSSYNTFGNCENLHHFHFSGNKVMLWLPTRLYELKDNNFTELNLNFPIEERIVTKYVESGSTGFYIGLQRTLDSGKKVSDIVLLKN